MAECAVIEYLFEVSLCVCCGYSFGLDFWVSNERWLDGCLHFTDLGYCLASLLLLLSWPLSPLLLLLKVLLKCCFIEF